MPSECKLSTLTIYVDLRPVFEGLYPEVGSSGVEKEAECVSCVSSLGSRQMTWSFSF